MERDTGEFLGLRSAKGKERKIVSLVLDNKIIRLDKERIVLGSVESSDVRLAGEGVSPIHAVLEVSGDGKATIYDLASDSGLFINGEKAITRVLNESDEITIGRNKLRFKFDVPAPDGPGSRILESEGRRLFISPDEDMSSLLLEDEKEVTDIFDYRPARKQAIEVVMSWHGTIFGVEHFVGRRAVTIGDTRRCDFCIPQRLSARRYRLATKTDDGFTLHIDDKMKGAVHIGGVLQPVEKLVQDLGSQMGSQMGGQMGAQTGGRGSAAGLRELTLGKDDFAKISIGDIDFYLSCTAAPPRLKITKTVERDPLFLRIFFSSLALSAAIVAALLRVEVPQALEGEQLPERIATILYQPEKYAYTPQASNSGDRREQNAPTSRQAEQTPKPTVKPTVKIDIKPNPANIDKPVPKEMNVGKTRKKVSKRGGQRLAKEGEGARAKGKEGSRGSPKAKASTEKQVSAMRPSPQGGSGRGSGHSEVEDQGNVDMLKGAGGKIIDLLGNSASRLGKGGEKLKGFGGFSTHGSGGLALSGGGTGGGGIASTTLGGLSTRGSGGGRIGTGKGAAGSGSGIIGGRTRIAIRTGVAEEAIVMGSIDADAVEAALLAHRDEFRLCYEREINAETRNLAGRVGTSFLIGSSGRVTRAGVDSTTLRNPNTERCVLAVIKRIQFPIPRGAGVVQVTYPFKFMSTAGR